MTFTGSLSKNADAGNHKGGRSFAFRIDVFSIYMLCFRFVFKYLFWLEEARGPAPG